MRGERAWRPWAAVGFAVIVLSAGAATATADTPFKSANARVAEAKLFDLGVTDIDSDGTLDLFTTNHKFLSTFKLGNGTGFGRNLNGRGLEQTQGLPFIENLFSRPEKNAAGLYVWVEEDGRLHLASRRLGELGLPQAKVSGDISFYGPFVEITTKKGAQATEYRFGDPDPPRVDVDFELGPFGHIIVDTPHIDLPFTITVDDPFPVSSIRTGTRRVRPAARTFLITLRDRHGIAWADFGGDARPDAYIARGGLGGRINRYEGVIEDELLIQHGDGSFFNATPQLGIVKGTCRSRQANAIDYNRDGRLDLYSNCKDASPQLYRRRESGSFYDDSVSLAGTAARGTAYTWLDLDGDVRPELISGRRHSLSVFKRDLAGDWDREYRVRTRNSGEQVAKILPTYFDRGTTPDLFVAARSGNTIALNKGSELKTVNPGVYGLPEGGSVAAAWVDYDNDGRTDLHLVPQGLFHRERDGSFTRTRLLTGRSNSLWAIDHWADFDNDGDRDLLIAEKGPRRKVRVQRFDNGAADGHWLEVDLTGSEFNRQAIGSQVRVRAGRLRLIANVGESEGSRFSQGHYRLYFGLGSHSSVDKLKVRWPNGSYTRLFSVPADRRLEIGIDD